MSEEIAEKAVSLIKNKFDEYEIIVDLDNSLMLKIANGEPSITQSWRTYIVTIYAAKDAKMMMSKFTSTNPGEVLAKLPMVIEKLQPSPLYAPLPEPTGISFKSIDERIIRIIESGDLSDLVEDMELDQIGNSAGMIMLSHNYKVLINSKGAQLTGEKTTFNGYMRVFENEDASGQWSWTTTRYKPGDAKKAIGMAKKIAEECSMLKREKITTGNYRILLSPMVAGNLFETVSRSASGAGILFGFSFFTSHDQDKQVATENLSLMDIPLEKELPGYSLFDEEAAKTWNKPIIEKGILKNILHNSKTAKVFGRDTTGNAGLLFPSAFNLYIKPGDLTDDEMLEALGNGIYITNNWYTRFQNFPEGLFSTVARDAVFVVRNGKPISCTTRVRIADSMKKLLRRIEAVGKTLWQIQWWEVSVPFRLPHILISDARVTSE